MQPASPITTAAAGIPVMTARRRGPSPPKLAPPKLAPPKLVRPKPAPLKLAPWKKTAPD